jgi:hypothetical protein
MNIRLLSLCVIVLGLLATQAWAKRMAPKDVPPVTKDGVKYTVPLDNGREGRIEAWDVESGKKKWDVVVYTIKLIPDLEEDVQWVFINSLTLKDNTLTVQNEKGEEYTVDIQTKAVEKVAKKAS